MSDLGVGFSSCHGKKNLVLKISYLTLLCLRGFPEEVFQSQGVYVDGTGV